MVFYWPGDLNELIRRRIAREPRQWPMNDLFKYVMVNGSVDRESVTYLPDKFPFTLAEFDELTDSVYGQIVADAREHEYLFESSPFETYAIPLCHDSDEFVMVVMHGQGMAVFLFTKAAWEKYRDDTNRLLTDEDISSDSEGD